MDNYIVGRNAVKEALKSGRSIQRIMVSEDKVKTGLADIVGLAKSQGIEVRPTPIKQMNKYDLDVPHQGGYCPSIGGTILRNWAKFYKKLRMKYLCSF